MKQLFPFSRSLLHSKDKQWIWFSAHKTCQM